MYVHTSHLNFPLRLFVQYVIVRQWQIIHKGLAQTGRQDKVETFCLAGNVRRAPKGLCYSRVKKISELYKHNKRVTINSSDSS